MGRRKFSANFQLVFRLIKGLIFLAFVSILIILIALPHMTAQDIVVCILAFMPTGWGLLLVREFPALAYYSVEPTECCFYPGLTLSSCLPFIFIFYFYCCPFSQIAQACKPAVQRAGFWGSIRALARGYEIFMGLLLFTPVAFLAWFPFVSEFQTRMLFNQAFSRGLQISRILGGQKKDRSSNSKE